MSNIRKRIHFTTSSSGDDASPSGESGRRKKPKYPSIEDALVHGPTSQDGGSVPDGGDGEGKHRTVPFEYVHGELRRERRRLSSTTSDNRYETYPQAMLGSGGYAAVVRGTRVNVDASQSLAIKFPFQAGSDDEINVMRRLQFDGGHPLVLGLLDVCYSDQDVHKEIKVLVLPKCDLSLGEYLEDKRPLGGLPKGVRMEITRQLCAGLQFIHGCGIAHGDLSLGNVLVHRNEGLLKISDFGESDIDAGAEKRSYDLASVCDLVGPMWLGRGWKFGLELGMLANDFLKRGHSIANIRIAFMMIYGCYDNSNFVGKYAVYTTRNGADWEEICAKHPAVEPIAIEMHSLELTTVPRLAAEGIPVPKSLHRAVRLMGRFCQQALMNCDSVLLDVDRAVTDPMRSAASEYIRSGKMSPLLK